MGLAGRVLCTGPVLGGKRQGRFGALQPRTGRKPACTPHFLLTENQEPPTYVTWVTLERSSWLLLSEVAASAERGGLQEQVGEVWSPW